MKTLPVAKREGKPGVDEYADVILFFCCAAWRL
jgi:hypothetical protein